MTHQWCPSLSRTPFPSKLHASQHAPFSLLSIARIWIGYTCDQSSSCYKSSRCSLSLRDMLVFPSCSFPDFYDILISDILLSQFDPVGFHPASWSNTMMCMNILILYSSNVLDFWEADRDLAGFCFSPVPPVWRHTAVGMILHEEHEM